MNEIEDRCFARACHMIEHNLAYQGTDVFELTELLIKLEAEREYKNSKSDERLTFNDTIVSIEDVGDRETIDISVSGDNLFFCNGILTKNSWGLPQTADFMFALVNSDELQELNQYMVKQLKSRYGDPSVYRKFVIGVDRSRMKLYDVEQTAQEDIVDDGPAFDKSGFGERLSKEGKFSKSKFANFT